MKRTLLDEPIPAEGRLLRLVKRYRLDRANAARLAEIAREVSQPLPSAGRTASGDPRRLRGVPILAPSVASTLAGTDPLGALLAKERDRARRSRNLPNE